MKRNILLKLEYCGSKFEGWQIQAGGRTVQGVIRDKLEKFTREKINLIGSGRTDSGVHALAQYANFETNSSFKPDEIKYRLNKMLPDDIVVLACREIRPNFNARRNAIQRNYRYLISEKKSALNRDFSWIVDSKLDINMLNKMAGIVSKSLHFDNFCKVKSRKTSNNCIIYKAAWSRYGGFLRFDIAANRFLHNMVRLLVGTMVAVAKNKVEFQMFKTLLDSKIDNKTKYIAPACGLYLVDVKYEGIYK